MPNDRAQSSTPNVRHQIHVRERRNPAIRVIDAIRGGPLINTDGTLINLLLPVAPSTGF